MSFAQSALKSLQTLLKFVQERTSKHPIKFTIGGLAVLIALYKLTRPTKKRIYPHIAYDSKAINGDTDWFDAIIVGAGPAGSTAAFYMARKGAKVLLLDKAKFPRDKYCGDAVPALAQKHLTEMGVMQEVLQEGLGCWANSGGFVTITGKSFIGDSAKETMKHGKGRVIAIKRVHMDHKMVQAAQRVGAVLAEDQSVKLAKFNHAQQKWNVEAEDSDGKITIWKGKVLVCADGSPSRLARQLGIVRTEPEGVCSRAFVEGGTHNFKADGVVFYQQQLLPGYSALFRHPNDEINFCAYIIPGGKAKIDDLAAIHKYCISQDPFVSKALGPNAKIEPMKAASLRLGGVPKSYADNLLVIGDAAGFIDPLTGEGIQYACESGEFAAEAVLYALSKGDLSSKNMKRFQDRWMNDFGKEFYWSRKISHFLAKYPIVLDAAADCIQRRGKSFLEEWALTMTGGQSKLWFIRPDVALAFSMSAVRIMVNRLFGREKPVYH